MSVVPVSVVAPVTPSVVPTVTAADAVSALVTVADSRVARPPVVSLCLKATVATLLATVSPMMSVVPSIPMSAPVKRTSSTSTKPLVLVILRPPLPEAAALCVIVAAAAERSNSESTVSFGVRQGDEVRVGRRADGEAADLHIFDLDVVRGVGPGGDGDIAGAGHGERSRARVREGLAGGR